MSEVSSRSFQWKADVVMVMIDGVLMEYDRWMDDDAKDNGDDSDEHWMIDGW